jgi:hypothetical protein
MSKTPAPQKDGNAPGPSPQQMDIAALNMAIRGILLHIVEMGGWIRGC